MARSVLEGLKRKYGSRIPDIQSLVAALVPSEGKLEAPVKITLQIAGNDLLRAVTKAAIGFFILSGGERNVTSHLICYIDGETSGDIAWLFYPERPVFPPAIGPVTHAIMVEADPAKDIAFCIVEYFCTARYLIILSERYSGKKISANYGYDLLQLKEVQVPPQVEFRRDDLLAVVRDMPRPYELIKAHMDRFMKFAMDKQWSGHTSSEVLKNIWPRTFGKYPEGTEMTEEIKAEFMRELMKELPPYIKAGTRLRSEQGPTTAKNAEDDPGEGS
jgi:hypothetical protein